MARTTTSMVAVSLLALAGLAAPAPASFAQSTVRPAPAGIDRSAADPVEPEDTLAELTFVNGVRVVFSHSESSREYGLLQEGAEDENAPVVALPVGSMLKAYLDATPGHLPVPRLLLDEPREDSTPPPDLEGRTITASPVVARGLAVPRSADHASTVSGQGCYSTLFAYFDWHDNAIAGMAPKTYYSSDFDGKTRYSNSYVANCTPVGSPSYLYARHRIYYQNVSGNYVKQFDGQVPPGHWQAKSKGSVKRYRAVAYSDGWNADPSCGGGSCKYTREGVFTS
ncbi:hypothetical protein [Streptosporangium sp. KLBMP 9127]|nr:hypothetical protein [Streptosporangium sp. KLBMP 9127]